MCWLFADVIQIFNAVPAKYQKRKPGKSKKNRRKEKVALKYTWKYKNKRKKKTSAPLNTPEKYTNKRKKSPSNTPGKY